jgi:hypothetical protein
MFAKPETAVRYNTRYSQWPHIVMLNNRNASDRIICNVSLVITVNRNCKYLYNLYGRHSVKIPINITRTVFCVCNYNMSQHKVLEYVHIYGGAAIKAICLVATLKVVCLNNQRYTSVKDKRFSFLFGPVLNPTPPPI